MGDDLLKEKKDRMPNELVVPRDVWIPVKSLPRNAQQHSSDQDPFVKGTIVSQSNSDNEKSCIVLLEDDTEALMVHPNSTFIRGFLECPADLTTLSTLNAPTLLVTLKARYLRQDIYTQCGPLVLVAINPYESLDHLYDLSSTARHFSNENPHVYTVAHKALHNLQLTFKSQSIIISGESGAGKTVSAKHIMHYVHYHSKSSHKDDVNVDSMGFSLQDALMATNPLLEAFGNAKTERNDNSSRFGKYVKIFFKSNLEDNNNGGTGELELVGAKIDTFLLEKGRALEAEPFHVLNMSRSELDELQKQAMMAGISDQDWTWIQQMLTAIKALLKDDYKQAQDILGVRMNNSSEDSLEYWLSHKTLKAPKEKTYIIIDLTEQQIEDNRDALIKFLYQTMFDSLVVMLNARLFHDDLKNVDDDSTFKFIGILDIYGFEKLSANGLDQLCINYANESLQQAFTKHHLQEEQRIYQEEGLIQDAASLSLEEGYADHSPMINLIHRHVTPLLEEECRLPQGTDRGFIQKLLCATTLDSEMIQKGPFGIDESFVLKHFAYDVEYMGKGFCEMNKDKLPEDIWQHIISQSILLQHHQHHQHRTKKDYLSNNKKTGILRHFDESLQELLLVLKQTECHYIRCIKPNDQKQPRNFHGRSVLTQLEACGVLATIQLAKAGFPCRWNYEDLAGRFPWLIKGWYENNSSSSTIQPQMDDLKRAIKEIFQQYLPMEANYRFGKRFVFMQDGILQQLDQKQRILLHETLECLRRYYLALHVRHITKSFLTIRHWMRVHMDQNDLLNQAQLKMRTVLQRTKVLAILQAALWVQVYGRKALVCKEVIIPPKIVQQQTSPQLEPTEGVGELEDVEEAPTCLIEEGHEAKGSGILLDKYVKENQQMREQVLLLQAEVAKLRAQIDFCLTSSSTMSILHFSRSHSNQQRCTEPLDQLVERLIGIIEDVRANGNLETDDVLRAAKPIYRLLHGHPEAFVALKCFLEHLETSLQVSSATTWDQKCWWISNMTELCGYYSSLDTTNKESKSGRLLTECIESLQRQCVTLFDDIARRLIIPLSVALIEYQSLPVTGSLDKYSNNSSTSSPRHWIWSWFGGGPSSSSSTNRSQSPQNGASLAELLSMMKDLAYSLISTHIDSALARSLWTWIFQNVHQLALDHFMGQKRHLTWVLAVQVQYNLSLLEDVGINAVFPYWALNVNDEGSSSSSTNSTYNYGGGGGRTLDSFFAPLRQAIKVLLVVPSLPQNRLTCEQLRTAIAPQLSLSQLKHILCAYRPAIGNEESLEHVQRLLECLTISFHEPKDNQNYHQHVQTQSQLEPFSLQLLFTPKTPPGLP